MQPFAAGRDPFTHIFWIRTKSPFRRVLVLVPFARPMGATATAAAADIDDDDVGSVILIFSDGVALLMSMVTVVAFNWSMSM